MYDRHESQEGRNGRDLPHRDAAAGEAPLADRPMADREVPLPGTSGGSSMALHGWLDGDLTEADARRADARQVEFWARLATETERRRRMTTPPHVAAQIMAALPDKQLTAAVSTRVVAATEPTAHSGLSPTIAALIAAAMFAVGILVGKLL
jgi:hypothetical protein